MAPLRRTASSGGGDGTHVGEVLDGRFALVRPLGRGGAATVWLALDRATLREVALKMLHAGLRGNDRNRDRFARECEALLRLQHTGVSRLLAAQLEGERPYFAMERIVGWTLEQELGQRSGADRRFSNAELLSLFSQLTETLDVAHGLGIIHRDLKPSNIMLAAPDGRDVKVLDFGIAKMLGDGPTEATTKGRLLGSMVYMSPEQTRGDAVGPRSDVFALGVVLYEALTLRRLWLRGTDGSTLRAYAEPVRMNSYNAPAELLARIARAPRPRPSQAVPGLDPSFDRLVASALAVREADRPASAGELYALLAEALGEPPRRGAAATVPVAVWAPQAPTHALDEADEPAPNAAGRTVPLGEEMHGAQTLLGDGVRRRDDDEALASEEGTDYADRSAMVALEVLSSFDAGAAAPPLARPASAMSAQLTMHAASLTTGTVFTAARGSRRARRTWAAALGLVALAVAAGLAAALARRDPDVVPARLGAGSEADEPGAVARARAPTAAARPREPAAALRPSATHGDGAALGAGGEGGPARTGAVARTGASTPANPVGAQAGPVERARPAERAGAEPTTGPDPRRAGNLPALRARLTALMDREASSAELQALAEAISMEADRGAPAEVSAAVQRLARSSAKLGDLAGLERALDILARARKE